MEEDEDEEVVDDPPDELDQRQVEGVAVHEEAREPEGEDGVHPDRYGLREDEEPDEAGGADEDAVPEEDVAHEDDGEPEGEEGEDPEDDGEPEVDVEVPELAEVAVDVVDPEVVDLVRPHGDVTAEDELEEDEDAGDEAEHGVDAGQGAARLQREAEEGAKVPHGPFSRFAGGIFFCNQEMFTKDVILVGDWKLFVPVLLIESLASHCSKLANVALGNELLPISFLWNF